MSALRLAVITAGLTQPSSTRLLADRLTEATVAALAPREVVVEVVEVRDVAHDLTNHVLTGFASPELQVRLDAIAEADAVIVATPVYAASYSGLFKMLVDVLPKDSLRDTPVLLGATGGTARHSLAIDHALRPLFAHLGALVAPVAVFAASEDWGSVDAGSLGARIERAGTALARLLLGNAAPERSDPFEDVTPFAALLGELHG
ncbi:NADPH-dependent FMN reductase [Intrasporangium oryzae NRRL B-24470]|uniref:NADPH-dependent FMN reductase n=1 Tax=Intrasporangium oryzae NRRL B-24470 TaxID=1386089 RepID=W9G1Z3_9MICO|nr:CE1759 family FMN reductase [Intrasporangium oryzae]EWT00106.1 NADPH-dependent FMN reductase [Intrasporangium oryzae NRRL B-24470]